MLRATTLRVALAGALLTAAASARAEPVAMTFDQAIYQDSKEGPLRRPEGVACNAAGAVVVADTGNGRLVTYTLKDGRLTGGTEIKLAQLTYPVRVQYDSKGNVLALDGKTHRIVRLDANGAFSGYLELKGAASSSNALPGSFKLDASDSSYVLDVASRKVLVIDAAGSATRQLELPKDGAFVDVAVDPAGTVYALDAVGAVVWSAAKGASSFQALTSRMKDRMSFPAYLAVNKGKLFVVDRHGNGIVVLGIDGSFQGRQLSIGWNEGLVYYPTQLCITEGGEVLVADRSNNRVQLFATTR